MTEITNDRELKAAVDRLEPAAQRALAAQFAGQVRDLIRDPALARALDTALAPDAEKSDRESACRTARTIATASYTACGQDVDWNGQAEHFVAAACAAALCAERSDTGNPAWKAAIHARMAANCRQLASADENRDDLVRRQYQAATAFAAG